MAIRGACRDSRHATSVRRYGDTRLPVSVVQDATGAPRLPFEPAVRDVDSRVFVYAYAGGKSDSVSWFACKGPERGSHTAGGWVVNAAVGSRGSC